MSLTDRFNGSVFRRVLAAVTATLISLSICNSAVAETRRITIGGAGNGGLFYLIAGGMANLINKYSTDLRAQVQATSGGVENARLVQSGQVDMALVTEDATDHAWRGVDEFKKPATNLRLLFKGHQTVYLFVALSSSGIKTLQDAKGRRVTFGPPGAGSTVIGERIMSASGLKMGQDYQAQVMSYAQQNDALKDGRIDVVFNGGQLPIPQLVELNSTNSINLLSIPETAIKEVAEQFGKYYQPVPIPEGTFGNKQQEATGISAGYSNVLVNADLPDDVVTEIAKIITEHNDELKAVHPAGSLYTAKNAFAGGATYVPFHPGAIDYLKQIGLWEQRPKDVILK